MSSIPYSAPRSRFSFEQALLSLFVGLLVFGFSLAMLLVGVQIWFAGRIFPGVQVAGIDVGGLRPQEAAQRIEAGYSFATQGKILFRDGDQIWVATPADLGLHLNAQASARSAYQVGRTGGFLDGLNIQLNTWLSGENIAPSMLFDQRAAYAYLNRLAKEINTPTIEAGLELKGTDVVVHPGQVGRTLELQKTLAATSLQLQTLHDGVINLVVTDSAPVILDASKQAELARAILSQPLVLTMPENEANQGGPWSIDPQTLSAMLTFDRVQSQQGEQYEVRLNQDILRTYLANLAPSLSRMQQNARFIFNDDTRQLELIQPAVIGRELDIDASLKAVQEKLYAGEHSIPLSIAYTNPPITDQANGEELGIRELVHAETSYFYGSSASRVQNIKTAASQFHGQLVAPGEVFSMASVLGDITLDNGYAEALIILGGQTIKGVGGGVCQVSTTLFRAAFFTGFPIIERHAHAYRVYYYEKVAGNRIDQDLAGLDATVFVPLVDFKFKNDTPYWLLMETYVEPNNSSITWKFYSTSDGRRVDWTTSGPTNILEPPDPVYHENPDLASGEMKQVDWAAQGAEVTVNRTVYRDDTVYLQDSIFTHYQAWPDMFDYGPGTELPSNDQPSE